MSESTIFFPFFTVTPFLQNYRRERVPPRRQTGAVLPYSFPLLYKLIDRIAEEGKNNKQTLILLDMKRISGMPEYFERFLLGERVAEVLRPPYKILLLAEKEKINKFGENVAVNRGAVLLSTWDSESGMAWLLSKRRAVERATP